jgi:hypothetical protein
VKRQSTDIGRAGEFLAAYILETHGVEVHHVDRAGADLWCKVRGSIITVQVKTCQQPKPTRKSSSARYYSYLARTKDVDWYCFVALDRELLLMRPVSAILSKTLRLTPSEFNEANQRRTIEDMIHAGTGASGVGPADG